MKLILSRKGFDSASGGKPSPIFPDGGMLSLPIPDNQSQVRYQDIRWQEFNLGALVCELTSGRIAASSLAHLDPDLRADSLQRLPGWRPIFGQTGAAQGHLRKNGIGPGDLFLFFGLFRGVVRCGSGWAWDTHSLPMHVLWGWLQIEAVVQVKGCDRVEYGWAAYHPHLHRTAGGSNTLYLARRSLILPQATTGQVPGAGVFEQFSKRLQLTAPDSDLPSLWKLPAWFYPEDGRRPMTYHRDMSRWQRTGSTVRLRSASRGQEFILDTQEYPEAIGWINSLVADNNKIQSG